MTEGTRDWKARALELEAEMDRYRAASGKALASLQAALEDLRLNVRYLVFDLESTRRERDALAERLDGTC